MSDEQVTSEVEKKMIGLKQQNVRMIQQLNSAGVQMDLVQPRIEFMMKFLEDAGVITYDQRITEQLHWEQSLRSQLQPVLQQVRETMRARGVPQQTDGGLIIPGVNAPRNIKGM